MNHLWGNPKGDWQYPLIPDKISPSSGYIVYFNHNNRVINLPDNTSTFSIFTLGSLNPELLGLRIPGPNGWVSFDSVMTTLNMYASCYTEGLNLLRSDIYYRFNQSKELIIAVRWNSNFNIDYGELAGITIRFYIPEYLNQNKSVYSGNFDILSLNVSSSSALSEIQSFSQKYNNQVSIFANGYYTSLDSLQLDQAVDIIYSPIYKSTYSSSLNILPVFYSDMDNEWKCLFHIDPTVVNDLEFISNIDFYLVIEYSNIQLGLYIDRNNISNIRNVSYHDYSISTIAIENYISKLPLTNNNYSYSIIANVHKSAFGRNLINSNNELLSLYNINNIPKSSLLAGINANSIYNANDLEKSMVMDYMQSGFHELSNFDLLEIGGYGSIAKLIGDPLVKVENNWVTIPGAYPEYFTAFEYQNNLLTNYSSNYSNAKYPLSNTNATYVEFINGESTNNSNLIYTQWASGAYSIPIDLDYRVYAIINGTYTDVTNNISVSTVSNNNILTYNPEYGTMYIKTSQYILIQDGIYASNVNGTVVSINDTMMSNIPYGVVDVFINGYYLIQDRDYVLIGNTIYITNFDYSNSNSNSVLIRCYSFCNTDMSMLSTTENYYIENDSSANLTLLSLSMQYYSPTVMIVNNQIYTNQSFIDPYLYVTIKTYPVSIRNYYNQDSVTLFTNSLQTRKLIKDLNNTFKTDIVINNKTILLSAFLSTILYNSLSGIYDDFIDSNYIMADIGPYFEKLISEFNNKDPLLNNDIHSNQFSVIGILASLPINVPVKIYDFYSKVMNFFYNDKLDIFTTLSYLNKTF